MLRSNGARLFVLVLVHFTVDFFGGLTIPLAEPTLVTQLGAALPQVAILLGGFALFVNFIQPLSAWFLPKQGAPLILVLAPPAAAAVAMLGLTGNYWVAAAMLLVAGTGIGLVHPEAALAAHGLSSNRAGLSMGIFMSGGYFGFATGSLVSGIWVENHTPGLAQFWMLGLPAILVSLLVVASGLHRFEGYMADDHDAGQAGPSFALAVLLCLAIATTMCLLARFIPIYLVRRFPGQAGQGWGGATVFATGVAGALGSFVWGYFSEGHRRGRFVATAALLATPFLFVVARIPAPWVSPLLGLGVGATIGAVFPLTVVLARESPGSGHRLRMGLAIGGAWATGEVMFVIGSAYVGRFPDGASAPVATVLNACVLLALLTAGFALRVSRDEAPQEA